MACHVQHIARSYRRKESQPGKVLGMGTPKRARAKQQLLTDTLRSCSVCC
jgi:hypothetical protein